MIEAVENHMPETIIIDEIGTELEALAASTIAQRGVQLVGTAHGMTIDNIVKNPSLQLLVGGIEVFFPRFFLYLTAYMLLKSFKALVILPSPFPELLHQISISHTELFFYFGFSIFDFLKPCRVKMIHTIYKHLKMGNFHQSVTLGDEEARKRKVQKTILERKGPPTFTCAVEMISKTECRVHHRLDATVDALLAGNLF